MATLGISSAAMHSGKVLVLAREMGRNDALAVLIGRTCVVLVDEADVASVRAALDGVDSTTHSEGRPCSRFCPE